MKNVLSYLGAALFTASVASVASAAPAKPAVCPRNEHLLNWQLFEVCKSVCDVRKPQNVDEVIEIVKFAAANGKGVKAIGGRHSFTDNMCKEDAIIIDMVNVDKVVGLDKPKKTIIVEAGMRFGALATFLKAQGLSYGFATVEWPLITVGGALANSGHHTGWTGVTHATVPSATLSVDLVKPNGELVTISAGPEFQAVRTNLGLLGVVVRIKYAVEELTNIKMGLQVTKKEEILQKGFLPLLEKNTAIASIYFPPLKRFFSLTMNRQPKTASVKVQDQTVAANGLKQAYGEYFRRAWTCHTQGKSCDPNSNGADGKDLSNFSVVASEPDVVHATSSIFTKTIPEQLKGLIPKDWTLPIGIGDNEIAVPLKLVTKAVQIVDEVFSNNPLGDGNPLSGNGATLTVPVAQFRFAKADELSYLALNSYSGYASDVWSQGAVWIETWYLVAQKGEDQAGKLRGEFERRLVTELGGRLHWGKNRRSAFEGGAVVDKYGDRLARFNKIRKRFDPTNMFYNEFAKRAGF